MTALGQLEAIFPGASEMAQRMRAHQWSDTPLGSPATWPETLKTALRIMLTSRYAMWMGWGPELTFFYNDAYGQMTLGPKHPWALGRSVRDVWAEIWNDVGPRAESVLRSGEATWDEALLLFLQRLGFPEETYHTFSYSPLLDDAGAVGGMLCVVTEDTERVIGERRLRILRELAAATVDAKSAAEACRLGARTLSNHQFDVPFALLYLLEDDGTRARLAASAGLEAGSAAAPELVGLDAGAEGGPWPFREVQAARALTIVDHLGDRFGAVHAGPWPEPIGTALMVPLGTPEQVSGFFIAGASARRPFDDGYRDFLTLVSGQLSSALTSAEAFETERRRAETLAELDRAKTVFFSNVSHEFRTPLTLMLGPIEDALADHEEQLAAPHRQRLAVAHRNSLRLLKLVNTLLDFSRLEAGRIEAVYEPVDIAAYTSELTSVFRAATERAGLSLDVACEPVRAAVYVDREMWEKVILNLLSNAFKFTLQGGIVVSVAERAPAVVVSVRDTGSGIPRHELPHIFERFHRVKGSTGRTHEGTGIGLALVQELVKLHGGTVTVESEIGVGTTFTIALPTGSAHLPPERVNAARTLGSTGLGAAPYVEEALRWLPEGDIAAVEARTWSAARAPSAGARVLVADDNQDMREYLRRLLSTHWQVETVEDGEAALAAVRRQRPELVLTDVMMPKRDGFGVLKALRADPETRALPVILLSARAGEEARVEGLDAGADDYLVKPFGARELLARVNTHLEMARVRRAQADEREHLLAIAERARIEAEDANRAKDEFLAVLSHELRSPMNAMLGWLQILRTGGTRDPELVGRAVDTIERNIWVQAQVINDLLDVSRILSGKLQLDSGRLELTALVHACVESLRPSAEGKQIALRLDLPGDDLEVIGDAARLQQVVSNLVVNAVKFTDPGGVVTVAIESDRDMARLTVEDTGQGIAPEFLPHIFERFRQADSSAARRHGGLGLGLSIVKNLVALHGGAVEATSPGVGRGARFSVRLPLAEGRERVSAGPGSRRPDAPSESLPPLDVLLVEDDPDSREALELVLAESGARVRAAASVRQALDQYRLRPPDVMISDIGMPGEDGYVLIRAVREIEEGRGRRTLAIAMTGFASRQDHEMALRAGFDDHIAKPVEPAALLDRMRVLAAARASRDAPPRRT